MGGPIIPWRPGRVDYVDGKLTPPDGRLPETGIGKTVLHVEVHRRMVASCLHAGSDKIVNISQTSLCLVSATTGATQIRELFGRMGFNDQEIVALCGAHSVGR
jgi:catalase (peroxidase I)